MHEIYQANSFNGGHTPGRWYYRRASEFPTPWASSPAFPTEPEARVAAREADRRLAVNNAAERYRVNPVF